MWVYRIYVLLIYVHKANVFNKKKDYAYTSLCILYIYNGIDNSIACEWTAHWEWRQNKTMEANSFCLYHKFCAMVQKESKCMCMFRYGETK